MYTKKTKVYSDLPAGVTKNTFDTVISAAYTAYIGSVGSVGRTDEVVLPSVDDISRYAPSQKRTISKVIATPEFRKAMQMRGIPWGENDGISPEQQFCLSIITDPTNRRPLGDKLRSAGVPYAKYRAWLKQPLFKQYVMKISEDMLQDHISDVHVALTNKAISGDINAIKLHYEITGRHDPAAKQQMDVQRVIGLVLEAITRNVRDTSTLNAIAADINIILSGKSPQATIVQQPLQSPNINHGTVNSNTTTIVKQAVAPLGYSNTRLPDDFGPPTINHNTALDNEE